MRVTVSARGLDDVTAALGRMAGGLDEFPPASVEAEVLAVARRRARRRTGRMAASLNVTRTAGRARIGSPLVYAAVQHAGWPRHNISPNPFLADAEPAALDSIAQAVDNLT